MSKLSGCLTPKNISVGEKKLKYRERLTQTQDDTPVLDFIETLKTFLFHLPIQLTFMLDVCGLLWCCILCYCCCFFVRCIRHTFMLESSIYNI